MRTVRCHPNFFFPLILAADMTCKTGYKDDHNVVRFWKWITFRSLEYLISQSVVRKSPSISHSIIQSKASDNFKIFCILNENANDNSFPQLMKMIKMQTFQHRFTNLAHRSKVPSSWLSVAISNKPVNVCLRNVLFKARMNFQVYRMSTYCFWTWNVEARVLKTGLSNQQCSSLKEVLRLKFSNQHAHSALGTMHQTNCKLFGTQS